MNLDWFLNNPITIGQVVRVDGVLPPERRGFPERRVKAPFRLAGLPAPLPLAQRTTLRSIPLGYGAVVAPIGLLVRVMGVVVKDAEGVEWRPVCVAQEDLPEGEIGFLPADTVCQEILRTDGTAKATLKTGTTFVLQEGLLADYDHCSPEGAVWVTVLREGDYRVMGYAVGFGDPVVLARSQVRSLLSYDKARAAWRDCRGLPPLEPEEDPLKRRRKMDLGPVQEEPEED